MLPSYIPSLARSSAKFPDSHYIQPGWRNACYFCFTMNGTKSVTSPLAALALAHCFVPGHGEGRSASSTRVVHVDFGRLSLLLSIQAKKKSHPAHAFRAEGFWGSLSEQMAFGVLAIAGISSAALFFVQSAVQ
jgi:hypothetical protein